MQKLQKNAKISEKKLTPNKIAIHIETWPKKRRRNAKDKFQLNSSRFLFRRTSNFAANKKFHAKSNFESKVEDEVDRANTGDCQRLQLKGRKFLLGKYCRAKKKNKNKQNNFF